MPKSKRTAKQATPASTPETSKPSLRIEIDNALLKRFRSFDAKERQLIGEAINQVSIAWDNPHLHGGAGIRKLAPTYFECRSGLSIRLIFKVLEDNCLYFVFIGNHDEIRRFIKSV